MHLWDSEGINRLVFGVSIVFVLVLMLGVFGDILTRAPMSLPRNAPAPVYEQDVGSLPAHVPGHPATH